MEEQGREKVPLEGRTPEKELEKQEAMGVGGGMEGSGQGSKFHGNREGQFLAGS